MDSKADEPVRSRMESLRLGCEGEIRSQKQKIDALTTSLKQTLASIEARAQETVQSQGNFLEVKAKLREVEDVLVKALSVKNRKEAKRIAIMDSLLATKSRVEDLKRNLQDQRTKRDEHSEILSQQSSGIKFEYKLAVTLPADMEGFVVLEETCSHNGIGELQEAISWYNRVLGFHVEGGHGVKFIFKKISESNPNEEFSFTIRHADDTYTLLDCKPQLDDIKELICELNRTNGLFKFVRIMRRKFQEAATQGILPQSTSLSQESSVVSASAPACSISVDINESSAKKNEYQVQGGEVDTDRHSKKQNKERVDIDVMQSSGSVRRSSRSKNEAKGQAVSR